MPCVKSRSARSPRSSRRLVGVAVAATLLGVLSVAPRSAQGDESYTVNGALATITVKDIVDEKSGRGCYNNMAAVSQTFNWDVACPPSNCGSNGCSTGTCSSSPPPPPRSASGSAATMAQAKSAAASEASALKCGQSAIDLFTFNYIHTADDLLPADGTWQTVGLRRILRTRDMTFPGSFGPGTFSQYDYRITFGWAGGGRTRMDLVDPNLLNPRRLVAIDGRPGEFRPTTTSDFDADGYDSDPNAVTWVKTRKADGTLTSNTHHIKTMEVRPPGGLTVRFEKINLAAPGGSTDWAGRPVRVEDDNGLGFSINYRTWTQAELDAAPDRQWQMASVADDRGGQIDFTYAANKVGGRWAIESATTGAAMVSYAYADNRLATITGADGAVSTLSVAPSPDGNFDVMSFFDPAAGGTHRRKTVYLGRSGMGSTNKAYAWVMNGPSQLVRSVINGDDEVAFYAWDEDVHAGQEGSLSTHIYEGPGRFKRIDHPGQVYVYPEGSELWPSDRPAWQDGIDGKNVMVADSSGTRLTPTAVELSDYDPAVADSPVARYDESGRSRTFEYDAAEMATAVGYDDGTAEAFAYDDRNNLLRYKDRIGRVTRHTYDADDNRLSTEIGLTASAGDLATATLTPTAENATTAWTYDASGDPLTETDALGRVTNYEYLGGRISKITSPPDAPGGPRAETSFVYHADGRLDTVFNPDGTGISYDYDALGRRVKTTYSDGTSEAVDYATTGPDAGLVVKEVDRAGVVTELSYDGAGRLATRTEAAAVRDAGGNETPTPAGVALTTTYEYAPGTEDVIRTVRSGSETLYEYDSRGRLVSSTVRPDATTTLTTAREYRDGQLFRTTDPYGRSTYHAYDACCGRKIRTVAGAVPAFTLADEAAVLTHTRDPDGTPNSTSLVSDVVYDAAGQVTSTVDPRGIAATYAHDSVGRRTVEIAAAGTPVESRTETDYDLVGNVVEVRSPRYFDAADAAGHQAARTTMTYTGRDLLATRTEAPGTPVAATVSYAYRIDGNLDTKTDERGNVWTSYEDDCCERHTASSTPLDEGTITNTDPRGLTTHTAAVANVSQQADFEDPADADTLSETTTRHDARGRPVARTVWLVPRGPVDPADPPIAANPADGLTSTWDYDDDLTDGVGLDATFSQYLAGLNLGAGAAGSGTLTTNAAGERTLSLSDGAGRTVRTVQLASDDSALTQSTRSYDAIVTVAGYGDVLETTGTNLRGDASKSRSDAAGRTLESVDALGNVSTFTYDAAGNVLASRDPNGVGRDCTYDALGRDVSCTDTAGAVTGMTYDLAGNVVAETDAKGAVTNHAFDARGRETATTDRLQNVTAFDYDLAGNLLSLTDAEGGVTAYAYDDAGRKVSETYPDHVPASTVGQAGYGIVELAYDAAGRLLRRTDQLGETITHLYDLAGRRTVREYRTAANSPAGPVADQDDFGYDDAGRLLSATKGRYANTIGYAYDDGGRIASEYLTVSGQTYTIGRGYDDAGHLDELTYPDGTVVDRLHDARGLLAAVDYGGSTVASFGYDAGGRETTRTFGNGLVTTTSYVADDNLLASLATPNVGTYSYSYDINKNRTAETINGVMSGYGYATGPAGYDNEDRLVNWDRSDGQLDQDWTLSAVGDWDRYTENATVENRTHNAVHELTGIDGTGLTYDPKGNLTSDHLGRSFAWDADNMLQSCTVAAGASVGQEGTHSYAYDAIGRRVSKTVDNGDGTFDTTVFSQLTLPIPPLGTPGGQVLAEYAAGVAPATPERSYAFGSYVDEPLVMDDGASTLYYHRDGRYSVVALTDATGVVEEQYGYDAYGERLSVENTGTPGFAAGRHWGFTGRWHELKTGLQYFRARYYVAEAGRFMSRDPLNYVGGEMGLYCFPGANPPSTLDPGGLQGHFSKCNGKRYAINTSVCCGGKIYSKALLRRYICCGGKMYRRSRLETHVCVGGEQWAVRDVPEPSRDFCDAKIDQCVERCAGDMPNTIQGNMIRRRCRRGCSRRLPTCLHRNRNLNNRCPAKEPVPSAGGNWIDHTGKVWAADNPAGEYLFHNSSWFGKDFDCYRAAHFQCCYDSNCALVTSGGNQGTYDYEIYDPVSGEGKAAHTSADVDPHWLDGNYTPRQTTVY